MYMYKWGFPRASDLRLCYSYEYILSTNEVFGKNEDSLW